MFEKEKQIMKDEATDAFFEVVSDVAFEVAGELLIAVFEGL